MSSLRGRVALGAILLAALGLRLGWALHQPAEIDPRLPDQKEYLSLARNLLAGRGLMFHDDRFNQDIYAYRTPGYPLFLAACGGSPTIARIAQAFIDTATVLAAYLLAGRCVRRKEPQLNDDWLPLITAALVAFNPFLIYFSGLILSETLFAALLIWGLVLIAHSPAAPSPSALQGGAAVLPLPLGEGRGERASAALSDSISLIGGLLLLCLCILVRPSALLLPPLLAAALPGRIAFRLQRFALSFILIAAVLLPWTIRNHRVLGEWVILTTNGGITRYDGFQPSATGASDQRFLQDSQFSEVKSMTEVQRDEFFSKAANDRIRQLWREHPSQLLKLTALKLARTWSPIPLSSEFGSRRLYILVGLLFAIPFYAAVLLGLFARKLPLWMRVLFIIPALYLSAVHALSVGSLRYRIPIEPPMAVIAAAGLGSLFGRARSGRSGA